MRLAEITPVSFRNLSPDAVAVVAGVTLVAGDNAQGKTNLLEAVAVLSGRRSFRAAAPFEMAPDGQRFAVSGVLRRSFDSERLSLSWSRTGGRRFLRGEKGATFREASALLPALQSGAIVTDVGSVKGTVVTELEPLVSRRGDRGD